MSQGISGRRGLYDPRHEHDACGVGFVADIHGRVSHAIVRDGLRALCNLQHRGAAGADGKTGDGAGILAQIPDDFFRHAVPGAGLPPAGAYGAGMLFLPPAPAAAAAARAAVQGVLRAEGLEILGWRTVPVEPAVLGEQARAACPVIAQCFVRAGDLSGDPLERKLFVVRRRLENRVRREFPPEARPSVCSLSARTLVYKGMMLATQMEDFYPDLSDPRFASALAVVHQRYSTNTFPSWALAQPFRYLAHNGEINTLRGNRNWMKAREPHLGSALFGEDIRKILPVLDEDASDSACLDRALELLVAGGRSLTHAMGMLIPQAWGEKFPMGPDLRGFFEFHAGLMEPWDGPAAVVFSDGRSVGAMLDRNGLRPARYTLTDAGRIVLASETGVLETDPARVIERGALRPGQMLQVDFAEGRVLGDYEVKMRLARRRPYRRWVAEHRVNVHGFFNPVSTVPRDPATLRRRQRLFGYSREDLDAILAPMALEGKEPIGSMGSDQPLAVFSEHPQLLYGYFKQLFAQVTNPPIDPIREALVMSLMTFLGSNANILEEHPAQSRLIKLPHPILSHDDLARLRGMTIEGFTCATLAMVFPRARGGAGLQKALDTLCQQADAAVAEGHRLLILSDRGADAENVPVPALLALAAVNRHLVENGSRARISLVVETGEAREVMHMALLLGFGASAINPYLAFESVDDIARDARADAGIKPERAIEHYVEALCKGILKILSKMGVSTLRSYRGAQLFEALGLSDALVERYFTGTRSRTGGAGLEDIAGEALARHAAAYRPAPPAPRILPSGGQYRYRRDGERHLWNPETIHTLQTAVRTGDPGVYRRYAAAINDQRDRPSTLRGRLELVPPGPPVPIDEVEPVDAICRRFVTGAMSFGSLSREAHETLAIAMNRIGAMSNSGEGGEDPARFCPEPGGESRNSAIKQVASGRFGVTAEYLVNARELQIKISQGAKPGEGGQLPGHKVEAEIAAVRHATPGVTLISPPPHHDIYSIEDIAQLIHDLKSVNPAARVSVKLVSESGVGTVAAGVVKGRADVVLISGYDGGTGAAPLSSIKHAGMPWEVGVSETHQTLVLNGLRDRVRLQVDGQLKTGRDVVIGALMGAQEFGFATTALVACGCVMMRCCHTNTCPVGIATQDPRLRKRFAGKPEHVIRFFRFVAAEAREIMAGLGFRSLDEMVGRVDALRPRSDVPFAKARGLDFRRILARPAPSASPSAAPRALPPPESFDARHILPALKAWAGPSSGPLDLFFPVKNRDRSVGAGTAGWLAKTGRAAELADDSLVLRFRGAAGQSFGAFGLRGMTLVLEGEANDYLGKSLSGAHIVVRPPPGTRYDPAANMIAGNVLFYGATSGAACLNGRAGERFCIRNSGAEVVVEGVGDHACEYMTGGRVVVLGTTGVNFAAGMSGGIAYVYDEDGGFDRRCNLERVDLELVEPGPDADELRGLIERHVAWTGSPRAARILAEWKEVLPKFIKVFPMEYRRVLGAMSAEDAATRRKEPGHE